MRLKPLVLQLGVLVGCAGTFGGLGCRGETAPPVVARKEPAFLRIYNASGRMVKTSIDGRAFGNGFAPGKASSMTRMPARTCQVRIEPEGGRAYEVSVSLTAGDGTTLYVLEDRAEPMAGERYAPSKGEATIRASALDPSANWRIDLGEGAGVLLAAADTKGGSVMSLSPGGPATVRLLDAQSKVLAQESFTPDADRSYTVLARVAGGKPKLEILVNNPPLSPRGRMGFSSSS